MKIPIAVSVGAVGVIAAGAVTLVHMARKKAAAQKLRDERHAEEEHARAARLAAQGEKLRALGKIAKAMTQESQRRAAARNAALAAGQARFEEEIRRQDAMDAATREPFSATTPIEPAHGAAELEARAKTLDERANRLAGDEEARA